jgi:hypothetical protein
MLAVDLLVDVRCGDQHWAPALRARMSKATYLGVDAMLQRHFESLPCLRGLYHGRVERPRRMRQDKVKDSPLGRRTDSCNYDPTLTAAQHVSFSKQ